MYKILLRFGVAIHIALLLIFASWARGGSSPHYVWALPWLSLGILQMAFLLPPRSRGDGVERATLRLVRNIFKDPLTYIGIGILVFLTVQWANGPRVREIDELGKITFSPPPMPSLPSCVEPFLALQVLYWFISIVVAVVVIRHALTPSARQVLLKILVVNGAVLSLVGIAQMLTAPGKLLWITPIPVYFFATFGYPNHGGAFFMLLTSINLGLLIHALGERNRAAGWLGLTFLANLAGTFCSLCRASMILVSGLVIFGAIYGFVYLRDRLPKRQYFGALFGLVVIIAAVIFSALTPNSPLGRELRSVVPDEPADNGTQVAASAFLSVEPSKKSDNIMARIWKSVYEGDRKDLASAAIAIWEDHPWVGVGGWGFRQYVAAYMSSEKWEYLQTAGRANVHNDAYQFICEHGAVGFGLMVAFFVNLCAYTVTRFSRLRHSIDKDTGEERSWFSSISPVVWTTFAGCAAILVHSTIDLPFRSVAVSLVFFIALACLPGFMPQKGVVSGGLRSSASRNAE